MVNSQEEFEKFMVGHRMPPTRKKTWNACAELMQKEVDQKQVEAIGWMYAYACNKVDCDIDIREIEVPEIIEQFLKEIDKEGL